MAPNTFPNSFYAEGGIVFTDGPPLSMAMSPEDAIRVSDEISDVCAEAIGQRTMLEIARTLKPT